MKRFSIRTLLLATLICAAYLSVSVSRAGKQKRGREWVADQRGHVSFAFPYNYRTQRYDIPVVPATCVRILGVDHFNSVHGVVFDCEQLDELQPITNLQTLRNVLINIEMDEQIDFAPLALLPNLKTVHFTEHSGVTSEQLASLQHLIPNARVTANIY